ncbi:MAG: hypothetical protein LBP87_05615 [Planctomycetaceae bacterium]|jgi:hypothetical protein|nr:hypothetical protein [Planctomycetaceae bacterium]
MKLTLRKMSNLRIILVIIFSMILCIGIIAAEEISDFEKLLRDALQNNQNNQIKKIDHDPENPMREKAKPLSTASSTASRNTPRSTVIDAKPLPVIKPKEPTPIKVSVNSSVNPSVNSSVNPSVNSSAKSAAEPATSATPTTKLAAKSSAKTAKPEPVSLNDGWVAIKPNDPSTPNINSGNEKSVLVAEATKSVASTINPNASVWDAVPEIISQNPKTQSFEKPEQPQSNQQNNQNVTETATEPTTEPVTEPTTESAIAKPVVEPKPLTNPVVIQPSPSPWETTIDNKNPEPAAVDWNKVANGKTEETNEETNGETDDKKIVEKKSLSEISEDSADNSADKNTQESQNSNESNKPNESNESADKSDKSNESDKLDKSENSSDLTVPKSKTSETITKKTDNAEKNPSTDMDAILNALAKESQESTEKKTETDTTKKSDGKSDGKTNKNNDSANSKTVESAQPQTPSETADQTATQTPPEPQKPQTPPEPAAPDFDNDEDETVWKLINADHVGDPHSKDKIKLMYDEIMNGLKSRNITNRYEMWKGYARSTLRSTAGLNTGSELDGRCRLSWYQQLYNEPIQSVFAVEEYSRKLHHALSKGHRHLAEIMPDIRKKMDVPERNDVGIQFLACTTPFEAVNEVKRSLLEAQMAHARALSTLTTAEQIELAKNLIPTFIGQGCVNGHTIPNRTFGRRLCNLMEKMDKTGIYDAAEALIPLTNMALLDLLDKLPENAFPTVMISGQKVQRLSTAAGDIIISGRENNVYDLDGLEMSDVACIIDLGGNDSYRDGTCNLNRPVLVIIDLHGNDVYSGSKPAIQGGSMLGVSVLIDMDGDDTYSAADLAQGSTLGGAGMLFDFAGRDSYKALRRAQGHALEGLGMLIDRKGNDKYRAAMWAQGFGAPGGFGIIEDTEGDDNYYCGGFYLDSYPEHPGYDGWGQGVGAGIRQVANGGVGALLDGNGDDSYEVDYFGHGGGYWLGVGFVRDFDGNDIRHGSTLMAYSGGARTQNRWTRFVNGFGCHYSLGYCFDDNGNDVYGGTIMGTGMGWDLSIGYLCDFNGSDKFTATGGMTQGVGAEGSIGILFNYGGDDQFIGRNQAYSSNNITYHLPSNCGGNFSFLINYGGNDKYGCGAANNSYVQRGSSGGFLIDRPTDREAAEELKALKELVEKRNKEITEFDEALKKATEEAALKGRRYVSRQRRPQPISAERQQRLSSVPHFENTAKTGAGNTTNVK